MKNEPKITPINNKAGRKQPIPEFLGRSSSFEESRIGTVTGRGERVGLMLCGLPGEMAIVGSSWDTSPNDKACNIAVALLKRSRG